MPLSFTHQKFPQLSIKKLCTIAKISIGQKSSFICSHVDSFTAEKGATKLNLPDHS